MAHKPLVLGHHASLCGDVTQNRSVAARSARALEQSLGYGPGRLAAGWKVMLLKQKLQPADFKFSGITLRSGGRLGLPSDSADADRARQHVSDAIMRERGATGYQDLQRKVLASITEKGPDRIVKVIPTTPHLDSMKPSDQYPMGGGGLQWTLIRPCDFLVAMMVDENGIACLADGFSGYLGESAGYDVRHRIAHYLDSA
jgi:hypothetical protein